MFNDDNTARAACRVGVRVAALRGPSFILTDSLKLPSLLTVAINTSPLRSATQRGNLDANEAVLTTHVCVLVGGGGSSGFQKHAFLSPP